MTTPISEETIDRYGQNTTPWAEVEQLLTDNPAGPGRSYWLSTTNSDGSPHSVGIGTIWIDGKLYVVSGDRTRKSRNLARDPRCVISAGLPGLDLSVEGVAARVIDEAELQRVAEVYGRHGWAATVRDGAFHHEYSAPSAGPPPWHVWAVTPTKAIGIGSTEPGAATRWTFA